MGSQASKPASVAAPSTAYTSSSAEKTAAIAYATTQRDIQETIQKLARTGLDDPVTPTLTYNKLDAWESNFNESQSLKLSQLLLSNSDPTGSLVPRTALVADKQVFNVELKGIKGTGDKKGVYPGPVTNQKSSGRCWLFASTNTLRYRIVSQLNLGDFQLSQSYLFFYDKLEKSNFYLENMLDLADHKDARVCWHLNADPISDGGQYDMVINLLQKYGCVPQALYPESYSSSNSGRMDHLLVSKLREFACNLQDLTESLKANSSLTGPQILEVAREKKDEMMKEIYNILCICLGTPPKADDELLWEYYDRDGKFCKMTVNPVDFYKKYTGPYLAEDCFSLVNDPRNKYDQLLTIDRLGNIVGGRSVQYVNTPIEALEQAVITCIKADQPVFFGCDVGAFLVRESGIMDLQHDYELAFGTKLGMTKAQRLQSGESLMTHAMVITAVHVDEKGNPVRYRIENSWSDTAGDKGFFMMTADWFKEFTYQVVIPKKLAPRPFVDILEAGNPTVLANWDPMGSLA